MTIKQSPPCHLVRESGFEPLKDKPADLQSAAFGHLAIPPYGAQSETRTRTSRRTPVPETGASTISAIRALWWDLLDSDQRRAELQSAALPTELRSHVCPRPDLNR